jgi:hypothetical protein
MIDHFNMGSVKSFCHRAENAVILAGHASSYHVANPRDHILVIYDVCYVSMAKAVIVFIYDHSVSVDIKVWRFTFFGTKLYTSVI